MTIQYKILTGMLASGNNINPFYGATEKEIERNLVYAKEIYKGAFERFLNSWVILKGHEAGIDDKDILQAIHEGKIQLPPKELEELA